MRLRQPKLDGEAHDRRRRGLGGMTRRKRFGARSAARPKRAAKPSGAAY